MKYKLLLLGTNDSAIDDFFRRMDKDFELLSTSLHYVDIIGHLKYYKPDAIVFCINQESRDTITRLVTVKKDTPHSRVPIIILGDPANCAEFRRIAVNVADFELVKPLTAAMIQKKITNFLDDIYAQNTYEEIMDSSETDNETDTDAAESPDPAENADAEELKEPDQPEEKKRVLIIDDDVRMLKVIKAHVEEKYTAATAVSGAVALRFLATKHVDLIILDYEMPQMNGPQVLEKLREKIETASIPVVFLTGAAEREKIAKALSMKPQGYLLKPVEKDKLMDKLEELIG